MPVMDYVNELKNQRDKLADILTEKGIEASRDEKFNTLIPKVMEIPTNQKTLPDNTLYFNDFNGTVVENGVTSGIYLYDSNSKEHNLISDFTESSDWCGNRVVGTNRNNDYGEYIKISLDNANAYNGLTIGAWFKATGYINWARFFDLDVLSGETTHNIRGFIGNFNLGIQMSLDDREDYDSGLDMATNVWFHFAFTIAPLSDGRCKVTTYRNGEQIQQVTTQYSITSYSHCTMSDYKYAWIGYIKNYSVINQVLSPSEIYNLMMIN